MSLINITYFSKDYSKVKLRKLNIKTRYKAKFINKLNILKNAYKGQLINRSKVIRYKKNFLVIYNLDF